MIEATRQTEPQPEGTGAILVVEDNPALRQGCVRGLRGAGFQAEGVEDGLQAAALLKQRDFDVVVSDITMPGMDGMALLRTVRQRQPDVPLILMTGEPKLDTAMKAIDYGAFRYLLKPFDIRLLVDLVRQAQRFHKVAQLRRQAVDMLGTQSTQLGDRGALEAGFERGLANLWMAYQPVVSWGQRNVFAYEAFARTTEPTLPDAASLFDAADRLGRLPELGRAIRNQVAQVAARAPGECIFVNLRSRDLLDDQLYAVDAPLSRVANRIVLEITERTALDDVPNSQHRVKRLRQLGFRIGVDNLGAGYAGLTTVARLQPEVVKLDLSLVRGLHEAPARRKLVSSMIGLFREMGILVVAEGVESVEERNAVLEAGCDLIQGHLFAKPGKAFPSPVW